MIYRNPNEADWAGYIEDVSGLIGNISDNIRSRLDLELAVDEIQQSILLSYYHNCKTSLAGSPRKVPCGIQNSASLGHTQGGSL